MDSSNTDQQAGLSSQLTDQQQQALTVSTRPVRTLTLEQYIISNSQYDRDMEQTLRGMQSSVLDLSSKIMDLTKDVTELKAQGKRHKSIINKQDNIISKQENLLTELRKRIQMLETRAISRPPILTPQTSGASGSEKHKQKSSTTKQSTASSDSDQKSKKRQQTFIEQDLERSKKAAADRDLRHKQREKVLDLTVAEDEPPKQQVKPSKRKQPAG